MDYADHAAAMDAQVDARLGDLVSYKRPEDPAPVQLKAFILFDDPPEGWQQLDSAKGIVRLKIAKQLRRPAMSDRITSPLLDGIYRPMSDRPRTAGRYWLADLQKV